MTHILNSGVYQEEKLYHINRKKVALFLIVSYRLAQSELTVTFAYIIVRILTPHVCPS